MDGEDGEGVLGVGKPSPITIHLVSETEEHDVRFLVARSTAL